MKTKIFLLIIGLAIGTFVGLYFTQFKSVLTLKRSVKTEVDYGKENDFLSDLINGHEEFKTHYYPLHEKEFLDLVDNGQKPGAIIITCSDSRIVLDRLFSTNPGQLFIVRNPGNLAPPYTIDSTQLQASVLASVEYAVHHLGIKDVIVMGHSDCGAMNAVYSGADLSGFPGLIRWLSIDNDLFKSFQKKHQEHPLTKKEGLFLFEKFSIVGQLHHLSHYPILRDLLKDESVHLHGWFYDVRSGGIDYYDTDKKGFFPLSIKEIGS